jgi:hypothetical protein
MAEQVRSSEEATNLHLQLQPNTDIPLSLVFLSLSRQAPGW